MSGREKEEALEDFRMIYKAYLRILAKEYVKTLDSIEIYEELT